MTQGRGDGHEWVSSYVVSYSLDAYTWKYAADFNGNRKVSIMTASVGYSSVSGAVVVVQNVTTTRPGQPRWKEMGGSFPRPSAPRDVWWASQHSKI